MEIGDRVLLPISYGEQINVDTTRYLGRVVWLHPKKIYYVAEFKLPGGHVIRESYPLRNRITNPGYHDKRGELEAAIAADPRHKKRRGRCKK